MPIESQELENTAKFLNQVSDYSYSLSRKNINDEFNELIKELNSENKKPYSIFYRLKLYSFLDGKYKYYRLYIDKDIITEDENNQDLPVKYKEGKMQN